MTSGFRDTTTQLEETKQEVEKTMKDVLEKVVDPQYLDHLLNALTSLCDEKHVAIDFNKELDHSTRNVINLLDKSSTRFLMQGSMTFFESLLNLYYSVKIQPPSRVPKMKDDITLLKQEVAYYKQLWTDVFHDVEASLAETESLWHHRMTLLHEETE